MTSGRRNNYVQIIRELGGVATAVEIFNHGCKTKRITGTFDACKVSLHGNIRKGNIIGKVSGTLMVAPEKLREEKRKEAPLARIKALEERLNELEARLAALEKPSA